MQLCEYGCGQEAKFQFKNGKWCCSKHFAKCPVMKEKSKEYNIKGRHPWNKGKTDIYSEKTLESMRKPRSKTWTWEEIYGKERADLLKIEQSKRMIKYNKKNSPWNKNLKGCFNKKTIKIMSEKSKKQMESIEVRKNISKKLTMKLKDYEEKYPFFCKIEPMRENKNGDIEVKCKYCKEWFVPTPMQLKERLRAVESQNGNMKTYLYCCKKHQYLCPCNIRVDPNTLSEYEKYNRKVQNETNISIKKTGDKIVNLNLRGVEHGYDLDHKYSVIEGFKNNISPEIIGHWKNLEILKGKNNRSKWRGCSITLVELLREICNEENIQTIS
jgi:hypothetical protein